MSHYHALLSIVYMMTFVALFEGLHLNRLNTRFCKEGLMSQDDAHRLMSILSACQE